MVWNRYREADERLPSIGYSQWDGSPPAYDIGMPGKLKFCWDTTGDYGGNHDLQIRSDTRRTSTMNGYLSPPGYTVSNLECSWFPAWFEPRTFFGGVVTPSQASAWALKILAKTNPSVPQVSIPTAIGELKDIPMLVKSYGDNLLKQIAHYHLSWRWGIKPMISDIKKLQKFTTSVNRRIAWLKKLRDGGFLKRKVGLGRQSDKGTLSAPMAVNSSPAWVNARKVREHDLNQWGSVRWKLLPGVVLPGNYRDLERLAWQLHLGITSAEALSTAWELMPWSWMVDWFAGVGDFINANNNTIPLTYSHCCFMRHLIGSEIFHIADHAANMTVSGPYYLTVDRKERYISAPALPFEVTIPALDASKLSVLASLAALKARGPKV